MGIGSRMSDSVAQFYCNQRKRYASASSHNLVFMPFYGGPLTMATIVCIRFYSRTAHPRFGAYRESSPLWRPTRANRTAHVYKQSYVARSLAP
jgi:hypothetical protein